MNPLKPLDHPSNFVRITSLVPAALCLLFFLCAGMGQAETPAAHTAAGLPAEGPLDAFMGDAVFDLQLVFDGGDGVREPYLAVALDGTLLALRNKEQHLRRSEDGGETWSDIIEVPFGFLDTNMIVDENTGDVLVVRMWDGRDRLWRSKDHGKTWQEEPIVLKPNEVMNWIERTGLKTRGTNEGSDTDSGQYYMHANASESGITLRHGPHKGRLLAPATFRPHAKAHPSDRAPVDIIYNCAIYSDDHGATWQVSGLFPEGYTEESAVAELSDGRIYYNSRSCKGFYDKALARELLPDERLRRTAWSYDGGQTWEDLEVNRVLPDGGGYDRGYGMKAGMTRLPVQGRDILVYSNSDTAGGPREKMTVWASFDGAKTWPLKRLVYAGPGAYSSMVAGRPGTPSEGKLYLLFEGVEEHAYKGMQVARFNLPWILGGELTGDGDIPDWVSR
jgi:sialidase-1